MKEMIWKLSVIDHWPNDNEPSSIMKNLMNSLSCLWVIMSIQSLDDEWGADHILTLDTGKKKHVLTEEEQTLRRSEVARRRKNQSIQRAEKDKVKCVVYDMLGCVLMLCTIGGYHQSIIEEASIQEQKSDQGRCQWRKGHQSTQTSHATWYNQIRQWCQRQLINDSIHCPCWTSIWTSTNKAIIFFFTEYLPSGWMQCFQEICC